MSKAAEQAWANAKGAPARSAYIAGYKQGAFDERLRVVAALQMNMDTIIEFAGPRAMDLVVFMLREMTSFEQGEQA